MPADRMLQNSRQPLALRIAATPIRTLMQTQPLCVGPMEPVSEVIQRMRVLRASCALVCDSERLLGVFTERDFLDRIAGSPALLPRPIQDFMSSNPDVLEPDATLAALLELIVRRGRRHLPVVQAEKPVGLVAAQDIVRYIADLFPTEVYNLPPRLDQILKDVDGA